MHEVMYIDGMFNELYEKISNWRQMKLLKKVFRSYHMYSFQSKFFLKVLLPTFWTLEDQSPKHEFEYLVNKKTERTKVFELPKVKYLSKKVSKNFGFKVVDAKIQLGNHSI